jgi:uncharacterized protein YdiU (UPF0061 family)
MAAEQLDFTLAFRWLTEVANDTLAHSPLPELFSVSDALTDWAHTWHARRQANQGDTATITAKMNQVNPVIIPRNHLVQRAIDYAEAGEMDWVEALVRRGQSPFQWESGDLQWARAPEPEERVTRTFCGT